MRLTFTTLFILISACVMAQVPVRWTAVAEKSADGLFQIRLNGGIQRGWQVYAGADAATGIEPVQVSWEDEAVVQQGQEAVSGVAVAYADPIFGQNLSVYRDTLALVYVVSAPAAMPADLVLTVRCFASRQHEFLPLEQVVKVAWPGGGKNITAPAILKLGNVDLEKPLNRCGGNAAAQTGRTAGGGVVAIFLLGFLGGLLALITPCVFPMVPVTVSFFLHRSKDRRTAIRNGLVYGGFILAIYLLASLPFHLMTGIDKNIFNSIATNAWVNLVFFAVFVLFALSFFGLFDITLPGAVATKTDARSGLASIPGIFFMALTLAVVSFSCTGVILGVLLANIAASGAWALTAGMGGFGLALALPFGFFAMFPNLLKKLPRSGSWLDTVKTVLAFVELALAFKFLSNADLVEHWGILKREVFIAIWITIAFGLALYLLGFFDRKIPEGLQNADSPRYRRIPLARKMAGATVIGFGLYLLPGLTDTRWANLKLLSGFPPPMGYSLYKKQNLENRALEPEVVNDFEKARQLAQQSQKPILIDFTGWACVNCRKMEEQVWTDPEVRALIEAHYILVSLYVDDRKKLPAAAQFRYRTATGEEKWVKTVGDQWAAFQAENFAQVTQPLYVVLSPGEELANHPIGYTPDADAFREWLQCGLNGADKKTAAGQTAGESSLP